MSLSGLPTIKRTGKRNLFEAKFVAQLLAGDSATRAYIKAKGKKKITYDSARTLGARLFAKVHIQEALAEARREVRAGAVMSVQEKREWLARAKRATLDDIDEHSDLAAEITEDIVSTGEARGRLKRGTADEGNEESGPTVIRRKVKGYNKVDIIKLDAQLAGELEGVGDESHAPPLITGDQLSHRLADVFGALLGVSVRPVIVQDNRLVREADVVVEPVSERVGEKALLLLGAMEEKATKVRQKSQ